MRGVIALFFEDSSVHYDGLSGSVVGGASLAIDARKGLPIKGGYSQYPDETENPQATPQLFLHTLGCLILALQSKVGVKLMQG